MGAAVGGGTNRVDSSDAATDTSHRLDEAVSDGAGAGGLPIWLVEAEAALSLETTSGHLTEAQQASNKALLRSRSFERRKKMLADASNASNRTLGDEAQQASNKALLRSRSFERRRKMFADASNTTEKGLVRSGSFRRRKVSTGVLNEAARAGTSTQKEKASAEVVGNAGTEALASRTQARANSDSHLEIAAHPIITGCGYTLVIPEQQQSLLVAG